MSHSLTKYVGSKCWLVENHGGRLPMPVAGGAVALPFVGGGSLAAEYARRGCRVIASDINARLVNAHVAVRDGVEDVISRLSGWVNAWRAALRRVPEAEHDEEGRLFFERVRDRVDEGESAERAASLLFVLRAGFNGLLRTNAAGALNAAYGKPELTRDLVGAEKLRAYAAAIQGVAFFHEDFAVTCARARSGWVSVLDPPYQGTFDGYAGGDWDAAQETLPGLGPVNDRVRLARMLDYLDAIGVRFGLSDSDNRVTRSLYRRWGTNTHVLYRSGTVNSDGDDRGWVPELYLTNWRP